VLSTPGAWKALKQGTTGNEHRIRPLLRTDLNSQSTRASATIGQADARNAALHEFLKTNYKQKLSQFIAAHQVRHSIVTETGQNMC
jgi:phage gpG-like protein